MTKPNTKGTFSITILFLLFIASPAFCVGTHIWEMGTTGNKGFKECKLDSIMVNKDGIATLAPKVKSVWKNPETYIWTILETKDALYIGTGGEGKIYKSKTSTPENASDFELFFDAKQAGVFSLAEYGDKIYAGTSPNGIIYEISKKGTGKIFKETHESYIWGMEFDNEGRLYAATGTTGKILRIAVGGKVDTFYTVAEPNISFFTKYKDYFYAGTGEKGHLFKIDSKGKGECIYNAAEKEIKSVVFAGNKLFIAATGDTGGAIYCITEDKKVEKIWESSSPIRGLAVYSDNELSVLGHRVLAAAGSKIYRIESEGTQYSAALLAELPTNITCMKGSWFGTSELGNLYRIQDALASKGTIESKAYDTKGISEWGRIEFEGTGSPDNESIELFTRSGATSEPDETWNKWLEVSNSEKIKSPSARFIQWKAMLTDKSDSLKSVKLAFLPQNNKPGILSIEMSNKPSMSIFGMKETKKGIKEVRWDPEDKDNDSLIYNLYFKLTEEKGWTLLKGALRDTSYTIDPLVFPDGKYEFKVEVSDSLSNSIDTYLKSEKVSAPYIIDNTGPSISIEEESSGKLKVTAVDDFNYIKSCEYTLDGGSWVEAFPIDRIFDSKEEEFNISVGKARKIVIRISDSDNNTSLQSKLLNP